MCNPAWLTKMIRLLQVIFLMTFVSCGQNLRDNKSLKQNDAPVIMTENNLQDSNFRHPREKHLTFNEGIDSLPKVLKSFLPRGYSAINVSSGDANLDGYSDRILVARKITEEFTSNYAENKPDKRILLLLLGQSDGSYKLALKNENAVYCIDCGGWLLGDPFICTKIKSGYFSIEHGIAGGQHWQQTTTFKFDKEKGIWFLYKDHFINYKLSENADSLVKETDRLNSMENFGKVAFDKFDIYSNSGH